MIWKIVLVIYLANYVQSEKSAVSEQRVVIHQVKSAHNDKSNIEAKKSEYREEYAWTYPSYEFSYKVNDPNTHDIKGQQEKRHGDEVKGLYWLIEPNGHKRTVNYQANDNNGFNANVDYTPNQHSNEYEFKNVHENDDSVKNDKEVNDSEIKREENITSYKVTELINDNQSGNEQVNLVESNMDNQNNMNQNENVEIGANESEISNPSENIDENQNNDNNMVNSQEKNKKIWYSQNVDNKHNVNDQEENKGNNIEYNNRRKKRINANRNINTGHREKTKSNENSQSSSNRNNYRYRNIEHNKKLDISNTDQDSQKYEIHASRGSKQKESNINTPLKKSNDEEKEQTNHYELRYKGLSTNEDLGRNIEENKDKKFEHRIRIYHPKSITSKP